jgi:Carboxypeptidase regulatory-like domain
MAARSGLRLCGAALLLGSALAFAGVSVDVTVTDPTRHPVGGARLQLKSGSTVIGSAMTDAAGRATFSDVNPGHYELTAAKDGFEEAQQAAVDVAEPGPASIEFQMTPALARKESIQVTDTVAPVEQGSSPASELPPALVKQLPGRPPTVADALPLVPGVLRAPNGGLVMSAAGEHRSALIVNSADVTDPATGQFGLTVPIDSVEKLDVYQTPFLAEYGRFTAGLVSVETRRGGDKWKWELNDPFPDFRIRSYHLRGLADATPRVNVEGPIIPGKLYFSEGFEYEVRKTEVFELPFPYNQKKTEGVNSFAQFDWIASDKQTATATIHIAPQRLEYANLTYFNPLVTSPDANTNNYTVTLADRLMLWGGLLENTLSATRFDARVWGQGNQDLTIAPGGNTGNYFAQQNRNASRLSWAPVMSFASVNWLGVHNLKAGAGLAESSDNGDVTEHPINILNGGNQLLQRITFSGGQPFRAWDTEYSVFGQDHWMVSPRLSVDLGLRAESQAVTESFRLAPRVGVAWNPFPGAGTVVRAGFGLFYDRVPLNVYAFSQYPSPVITTYGPNGEIPGTPVIYQNALGMVTGKAPFVFQEQGPGNFSPRSATGSFRIEQPLTPRLRLRVGYMQNESSGLVLMNPIAPIQPGGTGTDLLTGTGHSRYHQFEVTARLRLRADRQLFFSYVRSRARGDLNDFASYLGTFPVPLIRPNEFGNLPTDMPNRFLAWGVLQLPKGFRVAPMIEYRNGFPYVVTDAAQQYVGVPNLNRYPNFFSLDARFSKDIKVSPKYTLRLSVSTYNLTDHYNPEAFHGNIADPAYGLFFGQRGRFYTGDFDVLF